MPSLDWIGKDAVREHHRKVPYHLLRCDRALSAGDPDSGNLLVQGDNLLALKALLPYYAGKVKCVYIDPPYNTGNENWVYNDNVNSPEIRRWLRQVVGKEGEDLSRHDKWLCMMYPRLALLREFLSDDGAIFVSIDDHEAHNLRLLLDELFGAQNFIATIIWQKLHARNNSAQHFSADHDFILVFARNKIKWSCNKVSRTEASDADFWNPDDDTRGLWRRSDLTAAKPYSDGNYEVVGPHGEIFVPRGNRYWSISRQTFKELEADNRIWWEKSGRTFPFRKRFKSELGALVPTTIWLNEEVGNNREAKQEITRIFGRDDIFSTPKPERLLHRILHIATNPGDLVLDAFAGSGTTGAVAHKLGCNWLMVEMGEYCESRIVPRMKSVIEGSDEGGISSAVGWQSGGGFRFCTLARPLFDANGNISADVNFADLAAHVFFTETGVPLPKRANGSPLLGDHNGRAVYLLFNGVLGDRRPAGGNVLTHAVARDLPPFAGPRVVYAEACRLSPTSLRQYGITFRQVPFELKVE
jgi:adenine-specific DNA-methyltransferase